MNMPVPRWGLRLVARGGSLGVRQELIGDLLEEIDGGRSRAWVCQQLIGLYGFALMTHLRRRARLTPRLVALAFCLMLLAGVSIASVSSVLEAWIGFYCVTGTLSLFADMASVTGSLTPRPNR